MQPHPIPQNVTNFQFRLVGDMTLKQFVYLASGSVIAYIVFVFFTKDYPLFAWPVIVISALLGAAFAFLPINSRPLDSWVAAFFKAIYSPTKRSWKKADNSFKNVPGFNNRLSIFLAQPPESTTTQVAHKSKPEELPTKEDLGKTVYLAKEAQNLQFKIIQTEKTLNEIKQISQNQTQIPMDYSKQVNTTLANLQNLVSQASEIKHQLDDVIKPNEPIAPVTEDAVKIIIPAKIKQTQIALTTFPNIISGIIKNQAGNYSEDTVAVIYDKESLPVRALKTNKLGQFSGSTPLPNGVYRLELEKDDYTFDVLQIELSGGILPSLIITSKN